ncbi:sensor histidine kinase [Campylobacter ureolyticus]|uniref:histidine kinase n=1 Tax=Campylobacter ureolyticus TaxID=827 RepID=A0A9Q4KR78_9BACT|nr:HAMP domain-containing sensor histidine kinase [Campylobacter ureolyticus]MCZ6103030.1 HAMP domain-containing sensor histidine kinase [Campylobacter ureolyticus]MCZ6134208.1 HAMP domain-containing sensor histidine kinase [Campylobacter ureolyticus]MCZ6161254.1 HAMP domain-containing sensor histidine kinase [Campylobacter ureolyticus]MCZ6170462.1 HAMP domain-containing sensor histidine kinase [Campylobacter ureolyticus]MDU4981034.1 HAMP domain-containing sensor histidine kinase [Campylobacte
MLKIYQIFFINFITIFLIMFFSFSYFTYKADKERSYEKAVNKLNTIKEILSITPGNLSDDFIKGLALKTDTYIAVFDEDLGKFTLSNNEIIKLDIFLGLKSVINKTDFDYINKQPIIYEASSVKIANKSYIIVVATNLENSYINLKNLFLKLFLIFTVFLILTYLINRTFSKIIGKEIVKINFFLDKISKKDYSFNISNSFIKEIDLIYKKLNQVKVDIIKLDKKLNQKTAKIRLKNTQLEGILSAISHEFKNPVAIIKASSDTLKNDPLMSEEFKNKFIEKIIKNSQKIVNLVDKIKLSFAEKEIILNINEFNLKDIVKDVKNELLEKYKDRNILISGNDTLIKADKILIKQVILNLSENALKYSNDEIILQINEHSFFVKDKGIGIEEENLNLITKRYFRVSKNSWDNSLGLGLYIVKQILKIHNFNFIIKSEFGKGSNFGFEF